MNMLSKNKLMAMVAGTFIIASVASPFIVQASEVQQPPTRQHQKSEKLRQITPEQSAQRLSATFGIEQATILQYNANGMSFKDIGRAAFLANASGKSLADVITHKTANNNWKDVSKDLGITKEQMHAAGQNMVANHLNQKTGLAKKITLDLLQQGYHPQDIGMAAELTKNTNKPITEILSLKKINNRWSDVASSLGVDKETFKNDRKELGYGFGHSGHGQRPENK